MFLHRPEKQNSINKMNTKLVGALLVAILLIAIGGYFFPAFPASLGIVGTRFPNGLAVGTTAAVTQNKITIGNSGTAVGTANFGTCHIFLGAGGGTYVLAASSTVKLDCQGTDTLRVGPAASAALTGVTVGDSVFVSATTSFPLITDRGSLKITGVAASSTAGYIVVTFVNDLGASVTLATTTVQGWRYWSVK